MSINQLVSNLQGHELVLQSEINEIQADLQVLSRMHGRYSSQCGISFAPAMDHLTGLMREKERQLTQVTAQLRSIQDQVATSSALISQLSFSPHLHGQSTLSMSSPTRQPLTGHEVSRAVAGAPQTLLESATSAPANVSQSPGGESFQWLAPNGMIVTTNSAILGHSPQRQRM
jgi:hypothetical protein